MDLFEKIMTQGVTIPVSYVRGETELGDKEVSISDIVNKTVKVNVSKRKKEDYDFRYVRTNGKHTFFVSKEYFDAHPALLDKETGFSQIFTGDDLYLYICNTEENEFGLSPLYLNNPRGDKKRLQFKAQPLEFYAQKLGLIDGTDGEWVFNLEEVKKADGTVMSNLFSIKPLTLEVTVPTITEEPVQEIVQEVIEPATPVVENVVATEEVTQAIDSFESEAHISVEEQAMSLVGTMADSQGI